MGSPVRIVGVLGWQTSLQGVLCWSVYSLLGAANNVASQKAETKGGSHG